jgi:hypothetical protein
VLLSILALISMAFFSSTTLTLAQTSNQRAINNARMSAENGLAFMFYTLRQCTDITGASRGQLLFNSLRHSLEQALHDTPNLGTRRITVDSTINPKKLFIPSIHVDDNKWFDAEMEFIAHDVMRMTVIGYARNGNVLVVSRKVSIDFMPQWEEALGYGITSMGAITLGNNATIKGTSTARDGDGSLYSAKTGGMAVSIGSGTVTGNINVTSPTALVSVGSTNVKGGINYNAPLLTMPEVDIDAYIDAVPKNAAGQPAFVDITTSSPPNNANYTNVRVLAGKNPSFGNNTTIKGILYIEAPNTVTFGNNCTIQGVIVGQRASSPTVANNCQIDFGNNGVAISPVDSLPDAYPFQELRKLTNATVIAPDFKLTYWNNTASQSSMIAVRELNMKNNSSSTVTGSILIYGEGGLTFDNNGTITTQLSVKAPPPGFKGHGLPPLMPISSTYTEW